MEFMQSIGQLVLWNEDFLNGQATVVFMLAMGMLMATHGFGPSLRSLCPFVFILLLNLLNYGDYFMCAKFSEQLAATKQIVVGDPFVKGYGIEVGTLESGLFTVNGIRTSTMSFDG